MSDRRMCSLVRWGHLTFALALVIYLYTPLHQDLRATRVMQPLTIPMLILTGLWMWSQLGTARLGDPKA